MSSLPLPEGSAWTNIFQKTVLTDYSTKFYAENEYISQPQDLTNVTNPQITTNAVAAGKFVMPSRAYLAVRAKIVKAADGSAYTAGDNIALVNGWQAFRKVELLYNNSLVDYCDFPGSVDTVLGLLNDERAYDSKGSLEYRYYDDQYASGAAVVGPPAYPAYDFRTNIGAKNVNAAANPPTDAEYNAMVQKELHNDNINTGHLARVKHSSLNVDSNGYFWFKLPLNNVLGICKVDKPLRGIQVEVRLTKETDMKRVLLKGKNAPADAAAVDDGTLIIDRISLYMPTLEPHMDVFGELNPRLTGSEPIPLDYQRIWCNEYPAMTGSQISNRLLSNARRPRHVFLCLQQNERSANQLVNPLNFDLPTNIVGHVRVGNEQFPARDYNSNNDGYIRLYNAFLDATGKNIDRTANSFLTFDRWKNIYPIMYFDCSANGNHFEVQQDAEIVCNITADGAEGWTDNWKLVAIVISDEHKTITEQGAILVIQSTTA